MVAAVKAISKPIPIPIPSAGINAIANLAQMQPNEAIYIYNLISTQGGLLVRPGEKQWVTNMAGAGGVRTVIPVRGGGTAGAQDFLFACTINGIYNCTSSTAAPTLVVTFPTQTGNAGWGMWDHCTNAGGDVILMYCDEVNGYYTFDTGTSTWLKVTLGTGAGQVSVGDPTTFVQPRLFNNRVWFVQSGTGNSYYLPVGQVYGVATLFSYGNKFPHGGNLNSLWEFTYGSYFGTYVYLVGISDAGDVIAYTGADPSSATTWSLSGQWYVGDIVPGRRCASNYGGDLNIICNYGIVALSSLFYQKDLDDPNAFLTKKIAPAIKSEIANNQNRGWEIVSWPQGGSLLILDPNPNNTQFCYSLQTNGWSVFRGLQMQCANVWHGNLYFGDSNGTLWQLFAGQDAVLLNGTGGISINWGFLGAYSDLQQPGVDKFIDLIRMYFNTTQNVPYNAFVNFDFNIQDLVLGSGFGTVPLTGNVWDTGIWDSTLWGAGGPMPQIQNSGATGHGNWCALGCLGASNGPTTVVSAAASGRTTSSFL